MIPVVPVASVLGGSDTRRDQGKRPPNSNRFSLLRDRSRSLSTSGRLPPPSPASKRRAEEEAAKDGKQARMDRNALFVSMETVETKISIGKKNIEKLKQSLVSDESCNVFLKEFLGGVIDSLDSLTASVEALASVMVDGTGKPPAAADQQKATGKTAPAGTSQKPTPVQLSEGELRKKKFVSTVREAEKAVLVFGLDLGRVPTMNTGTLSRKVTEDITAKAALVDGKNDGRPSEDTVAVLEDTLSLMKGMEFFGKVTKPFANKNDASDNRIGKFHTLPVKMVFKDRDAKVRAEQVLRKNCQVTCTTPYPVPLRKAIKRALDAQKLCFPNEFIQVKVDPEAAVLKISRRADGKWSNNTAVVELTDHDMALTATNDDGANQQMMEVTGSQQTL